MSAQFSTDFIVPLFAPRLAGPTTGFRCLSGGGLKNPKRLRLGAGTRPRKGGANLQPAPELELQRYVSEKKYFESFKMLRDMAAQGYSPEDSLCAKLITGLFDTRHYSKAVEVMDIVEACGNLGPRAYCATLRACVMAKRIRKARIIYDRMVAEGIFPDAFIYGDMIRGFAQNGELEDAMMLYEDMLRNGMEPNPPIYAHLIEATAFQRGFDEVLKLVGMMTLRGLQTNGRIYFAIAKGLCKKGNPDRGFEFLSKAEDSKFPPTMSHYCDIISALWDNGNQVRALQFTLELLDKRMNPGISTYKTLISCLCKDGFLDEAIDLLRDMDRTRYRPDNISYCTTIVGLCKHDRLYNAIDLLAVMVEKGCQPNESTYICLVQSVGSSGLKAEALGLARSLHSMKAISRDTLDYLRNSLEKTEILVHWKPPQEGWYKLNTDGVVRSNPGPAGGGGVIRDARGTWCTGFVLHTGHCSNSLFSELWAIWKGLVLAWRMEYKQLIIETDSANAAKCLTEGIDKEHPLSSLVTNCHNLLLRPWRTEVRHCYRESNNVADWLSNFAFEFNFGFHVLSTPPPGCIQLLLMDSTGVGTPRLIEMKDRKF